MLQPKISALIDEFLTTYDIAERDEIWKKQSNRFRKFLSERVLSDGTDVIPESECDEIIRILDRNGKGNTRDTEAIAKVMVPQGAWRRMFNEFRSNRALGALVNDVLSEADQNRKASLIDELYKK